MAKSSKVLPKDKDALEYMRRDEEKGVNLLYYEYKNRLITRLQWRYSISEQDAEEVYNDAFYKFQKTINQYREECNVYTWLCKLAHSYAMERLDVDKSKAYQHQLFQEAWLQFIKKENDKNFPELWNNGKTEEQEQLPSKSQQKRNSFFKSLLEKMSSFIVNASSENNIEKEICFEECVKQLFQHLEKGKDACDKIMWLVGHGMSTEEIVAEMEMTSSAEATRKTIERCRKKIRESIIKRYYDECKED